METRIYERDKLYKEVWEDPMMSLSKRYGVSDVALRKQCKKMNIPLPQAGHWARVKAGHKIKIPPLPKFNGPSKVEVQIRDDKGGKFTRTMSNALSFLSKEERQNAKNYCLALTVPDKLIKPHRLINDTKQYYRSRKESTKPPANRVININVSDEQKERTYRFYNTLFKALEHLGYTVEIKVPRNHGYYRNNELYIRLHEDRVPIFIKEKQKRIKHNPTKEELKDDFWRTPSFDYLKTGKLHFGIDSYPAQRKNWRDTETKKIEDQIGEIVIWIMEAIYVEKVLRKEREEEEKRRLEEQWIREEIAERKEKELNRLKQLEQNALNWERADRIRKFADEVEKKIVKVDNKTEKEKIANWLKWARDKADWWDPLVEIKDELLGKNKSILSEILKIIENS